jgi:hypothetical protein
MKFHHKPPEKPVKPKLSPPPPLSVWKGQSAHLVPPGSTIEELEKKAAECEEKAAKAEEPRAAESKREAENYRKWAASLGSGRWSS